MKRQSSLFRQKKMFFANPLQLYPYKNLMENSARSYPLCGSQNALCFDLCSFARLLLKTLDLNSPKNKGFGPPSSIAFGVFLAKISNKRIKHFCWLKPRHPGLHSAHTVHVCSDQSKELCVHRQEEFICTILTRV